jgi:PAS domain S-box-containing protein
VIVCESILLWTTAVGIIHAFLDFDGVDNIGLFFLIVGAPFISATYLKILEAKKWSLMTTEFKALKKDEDVEMYIIVLLGLIEHRETPTKRIQLEGLLKLHVKNCSKKEEDCICLTLTRDNLKEDDAPDKQRMWYLFVRSVIDDGIEKFPKTPRLHMAHAFISHEKLKNKYKALFELMKTEENKPNIQEEFSIYRYKNLIEEEMVEYDLRSTETKGIDVNVIVHFQNKYVQFQSAIEKSVSLHLDFWRELLEDSPDIQKLQSLGSKITNHVEITTEQFKKLTEMNANHIRCLQIYGNFLKDIVNDDVEGQRILEKADYVDKSSMVNKQFIDNDRLKYGENSSTCIVTCSGNPAQMGHVNNVNNEITRILGYSKSDVLNQNINKIMPKVYADIHDSFMRRYFETSEAKLIGSERLVFPVNKQGYIVPCSLMVKILPNLDEGIRVVGFLKDVEGATSYNKGDFDSDEKVHYIMYGGGDSSNNVIYGITQSCLQAFGIPASLVYGNNSSNNEFTLDSIFPEMNQNLDDLKSPSGLITTIDTTNLPQNYIIGNDQDDEDSFEKENIEGEENEEDKITKYRRAKIRAIMTQDEDHQDVTIKVLKFVEVNEMDDLKKQRSNVTASQANAAPEEKEGRSPEEQKATPEGPAGHGESAEDANRSDGDQNSSNVSGSSVNEDMRLLKDFKALISEKTVPKSIKILKRTVILLGICLITLTAVELSLKFNQASEMNQGVYAVYRSYQRHDYISNINFNIRYLYLLSQGMVNLTMVGLASSQYESYLKSTLLSLIDTLQTIQFEVIKARIQMQAIQSDSLDSQTYPIVELLQNSQTSTTASIYNDALFQYITAASSIRNSSLGSFSSTSDVESTVKNLYFVVQNGLGPLRYGSESIAGAVYNFYYGRTNYWFNTFEIIMILGICFLFLSQMVLIPIVFSVHKTNNKVLSLFGYIPAAEITELANKCERFIVKHLEDRSEKKEYSFEKSKSEEDHDEKSQILNEDQVEADKETSPENVKTNVDDKTSMGNTLFPPGANPNGKTKVAPSQSSLTTATGEKKGTDKGDNTKDKDGKEKAKDSKDTPNGLQAKKSEKPDDKQNAENEEESQNQRTQKLLNSKGNNRRAVFCQFGFLCLIFMLYFAIDFIVQSLFLKNIQSAYNHLQLVSQRSPNLRFTVLYTLEEIVQSKSLVYPDIGQDAFGYYIDTVYDVEGAISSSIKNGYPSDFTNYINTFINYNLNDTCYWAYGVGSANYTACEAVNAGMISKGLQTSVVYTIEEDRSALSYYGNSNKAASDQFAWINSYQYNISTQLLQFIEPPIAQLLDLYSQAFYSYITTGLNNFKIIFAVFIVFLALVYVFIWSPYLANLSNKIWRTKGMLNMIPMDIIAKNENLKQAFTTGDLLQAVK